MQTYKMNARVCQSMQKKNKTICKSKKKYQQYFKGCIYAKVLTGVQRGWESYWFLKGLRLMKKKKIMTSLSFWFSEICHKICKLWHETIFLNVSLSPIS